MANYLGSSTNGKVSRYTGIDGKLSRNRYRWLTIQEQVQMANYPGTSIDGKLSRYAGKEGKLSRHAGIDGKLSR